MLSVTGLAHPWMRWFPSQNPYLPSQSSATHSWQGCHMPTGFAGSMFGHNQCTATLPCSWCTRHMSLQCGTVEYMSTIAWWKDYHQLAAFKEHPPMHSSSYSRPNWYLTCSSRLMTSCSSMFLSQPIIPMHSSTYTIQLPSIEYHIHNSSPWHTLAPCQNYGPKCSVIGHLHRIHLGLRHPLWVPALQEMHQVLG